MCMSRKDASAYLGVMELRTCDYNRLGNTQHRVRLLSTERRSKIDYTTQRYTEYRRLEHKDWAKRVILINSVTQNYD